MSVQPYADLHKGEGAECHDCGRPIVFGDPVLNDEGIEYCDVCGARQLAVISSNLSYEYSRLCELAVQKCISHMKRYEAD